jgi:hypothetical protein
VVDTTTLGVTTGVATPCGMVTVALPGPLDTQTEQATVLVTSGMIGVTGVVQPQPVSVAVEEYVPVL